MRVVVIGYTYEVQIARLRSKVGSKHELLVIDTTDRSKVREAVESADVVIPIKYVPRPENADIYDNAKNLKLIQNPWVGVDHLDLTYVKKLGVALCNSHWNSAVVAEFTLALMFSLAKRLLVSDKLLRTGSWAARRIPNVPVQGSNILILGRGSIPKDLVRMLEPFGANITLLGRTTPKKESENGHQKQTVREITWDEYPSAAAQSDFVVSAIPITPETQGILDASKFNAMKPGCIFVNIGRGQVVNEHDLYAALKLGHLGGAGIDVWQTYFYHTSPDDIVLPSKYPFHELDNVILSPHRAATATDVHNSATFWDAAISNIEALEHEKPLHNIVDLNTKMY